MIIYPAIDLFEGKAVRLLQGDYSQMTIYSDNPVAKAIEFKKAGASSIHIIDLEGARNGEPANYSSIQRIVAESGLDVQVGGGIRTLETIEKYMAIGVRRVILGTAAVASPGFLEDVVRVFGDGIAVSADIKDGYVAIKGWTELSTLDVHEFSSGVESIGVQTLICTDVSKDGLLGGTNIDLYNILRGSLSISLIASGGVSTIDEIKTLAKLGMDGAILGKALYEGILVLHEAISAALIDDERICN